MSAFTPVTLGRVGSTFTLGQIRLTETFHAGGTSLRLHDHEDYTINVVLDGVVEERVGRRMHECGPATLLAKPAGQHHANRYFGDAVRCVVVQLRNGFADPAWSSRLNMERVTYRKGPGVVQVARRLARVFREYTMPDSDFVAVNEAWNLFALCAPERLAPAPARWVTEARELLTAAENASGQLSDLASQVGVPPWVLSREFERAYGLSPSQYRRRARLQQVARQLRESDAAVSTLAHAAGFADHSHLVRWFRRAYRCTPTQYRAAASRRVRHSSKGASGPCKAVLAPASRNTSL